MNTYPLYQKSIVLPYSLQINLKYFWFAALVLIVSILTFYIFQINAFMSQSYLIQSYQKNIAEISEENRILEIKLTQLNYLEETGPKIQELGLERIDTIHYIQVIDSYIATR